MCGHATNNAFFVFDKEREVGQHQVDAMHVGIGEHETAVNDEQLAVLLEHHAVAADFAETAQEIDTY